MLTSIGLDSKMIERQLETGISWATTYFESHVAFNWKKQKTCKNQLKKQWFCDFVNVKLDWFKDDWEAFGNLNFFSSNLFWIPCWCWCRAHWTTLTSLGLDSKMIERQLEIGISWATTYFESHVAFNWKRKNL